MPCTIVLLHTAIQPTMACNNSWFLAGPCFYGMMTADTSYHQLKTHVEQRYIYAIPDYNKPALSTKHGHLRTLCQRQRLHNVVTMLILQQCTVACLACYCVLYWHSHATRALLKQQQRCKQQINCLCSSHVLSLIPQMSVNPRGAFKRGGSSTGTTDNNNNKKKQQE